MDITTFWALIETAREAGGGDMDKQLELLTDALSELPEQEIIEFERIKLGMMVRAFDADLWEAAWVIGCGCSDDGFAEFRAWLVAQGQNIFEEALKDPESLADVVEADSRLNTQDGRIKDVTGFAYERKTGQWIPMPEDGERPVLKGKLGEQDKRAAKFPRIVAKLGDCEEWGKAYVYNVLLGKK